MTQNSPKKYWLSNDDQAMFLAHRYAKQEAVIQGIWLYRRSINIERVAEFMSNLSKGLLGRLIERSVLPIGRHHWVSVPAVQGVFEMPQTQLPVDQLHPWAEAQIEQPLDPEYGPAWRLAAQSFADGSTCVSLTCSHCIADGVSATLSVVDAIQDVHRELGYPQPRRRQTCHNFTDDVKKLLEDIPSALKAFMALPKLLHHTPDHVIPPTVGASIANVPRRLTYSDSSASTQFQASFTSLATVSLNVDPSHWDQTARRLRADRLTLLIAVAGHLGVALGRAKNGYLSFMIPVSIRSRSNDLSANQVRLARIKLPVDALSDNLSEIRRLIRYQLLQTRRTPDPLSGLLPLVPFLPPWIVSPLINKVLHLSTDLPITCSHQGILPAEVNQIDGEEADMFFYRGLDRQVSYEQMRRCGGLLTAFSAEVGSSMITTIVSFEVDAENSRNRLVALVRDTLEAFSLVATIL